MVPDSPSTTAELKGCKVLVTRPVGRGEALVRAIEEAQGHGVHLPTIEIVPLGDSPIRRAAVSQALTSCVVVLFTSPAAVEFAELEAFRAQSQREQTCIGAIGSGTAKALERHGLNVNIRPQGRFDSETLLNDWRLARVVIHGRKVGLIKGEGGRGLLPCELRRRGAVITEVNVYRRVRPLAPDRGTVAHFRAHPMDAVVATSVEAVDNLFLMMGTGFEPRLEQTALVTVSERIGAAARARGIRTVVTAQNASNHAILAALASWWAESGRTRKD